MLTYTAWITGGVVSAPFATAFLSGCTGADQRGTGLHFFESDQFDLITLLADAILPRTDSPSATDMNVHLTIDSMMGQVFEEDFKTDFKNQFAALQTYLNRQNFLQAESPVQEKILSDLELSREEEVQSARQAFVEIKQQTIAYYLSTEEIAKNYLNYLPIPGEYKPCISVEEVNNTAWAI